MTGGFDPIHSGHIIFFNAAKKLGSKLIVGVNSDDWLKRKKGKYFMNVDERKIIISNLAMVDNVIEFEDNDNTAIDAIRIVLEKLSDKEKLIFANGGDRKKGNTPELNHFNLEKKLNLFLVSEDLLKLIVVV